MLLLVEVLGAVVLVIVFVAGMSSLMAFGAWCVARFNGEVETLEKERRRSALGGMVERPSDPGRDPEKEQGIGGKAPVA